MHIYYNGNMEGDGTGIHFGTTPAVDGRVVVGRNEPEADKEYAGVEVDELLVFNSNLDGDQIKVIYNQQN